MADTPQPDTPQFVQPSPVPMSFQVFPHPAGQHVLLVIHTPQGSSVFHIPITDAVEIGTAIAKAGSPIMRPPSGLFIPG